MADYLRYINQNATRNQPLSEDLRRRLAYLQGLGITAEIFSGGQDGIGEGDRRTGSTRHDHGNAADVRFYNADGRQLDWSNKDDVPVFQQIVSEGVRNGITGFGAGPGYMAKGSMHIGMGNPGVWGAGGKSANAPDWLRSAFDGSSGNNQQIAQATPSAAPVVPVERSEIQNNASAQTPTSAPAPTPAEKPKTNNGILVQAFNKLTGSKFEIPDHILGLETKDLSKGADKLGKFAALMSQDTNNINSQIRAASAAAGDAPATPIELSFISSLNPDEIKKKKGGLAGFGGFSI